MTLTRVYERNVQDAIGLMGKVVKPVCDGNERLARSTQLAERAQDGVLGDGVQRGGCFINDNESGRAVLDTHKGARAGVHRVNAVVHIINWVNEDLRRKALLFATYLARSTQILYRIT